MIAKISSGTSLYGTLAYNQNKVDKGKGYVLNTNLIRENENGSFDINKCVEDFKNQMPKEYRVEKPVIHISLNPHPNDVLTDVQLSEIAKEYMEAMGYGKQPYIVYKHEDIERHHIHIVSLRVNSNGKKINDSNERYRSKKVIRGIEKKYNLISADKKTKGKAFNFKKINPINNDIKRQIANIIKPIYLNYHFQSFNEYKTLLSLYNIKVEIIEKKINGKKINGLIYYATNDKGKKISNPIKSSLFGKNTGYDSLIEKIEKSKEFLKGKNYKETTKGKISAALKLGFHNKKDFILEIKKMNIDVIFRENSEGRIYGVTFIDQNNKSVFNGSKLGKEYSANIFNKIFTNQTENGNHKRIKPSINKNTYNFKSNKDDPNVEIKETQTSECDNDSPNEHTNNKGLGILERIFNVIPFLDNSEDWEEESFIKRMKGKKKKRGKKL